MNRAKVYGSLAEMLGPEKTEEMLDGLLQAAKEALIPLDLDALVGEGVLEKQGVWYRILKPEALPAHTKKKISTISQKRLPNGDMSEALVKFHKPISDGKRREFEKIVKRIEG